MDMYNFNTYTGTYKYKIINSNSNRGSDRGNTIKQPLRVI